MTTPEQPATLPGIHAMINRRLSNLEHRSATTILVIDAGGTAWNNGNAAWIDPATAQEWSELRVYNTDVGSQIFRNVTNVSGTRVWSVTT